MDSPPVVKPRFTPMIEYISGTLTALTPTYAVVEAAGVGYRLDISLTTFSALEKQGEGVAATLLVHEIIREDTHDLFGFATEEERSLFRALVSVSGVGANTARMILSSASPDELGQVIATGDAKRLKAVKGVGTKTAERIIVDLRDKIKVVAAGTAAELPLARQSASETQEEALAALMMLGFPRPQSLKVLKKIFDADPAASVETAIKRALTMF